MSEKPINLIGLTGYAGTGKDTVAAELNRHGYQTYALAQPLKAAIVQMFNLDADAFEDREKKEAVLDDIGASPRYLAQTIGTEWGRRMIADDLWVRVMRRQIQPMIDAGNAVVVSDVRFDNEAMAIRDMGGVIVRIRRLSVDIEMKRAIRRTRWRRRLWRCGLPISPVVHPSEFGVSDSLVDWELANGGGVSDLQKTAAGMVRYLPLLFSDKDRCLYRGA